MSCGCEHKPGEVIWTDDVNDVKCPTCGEQIVTSCGEPLSGTNTTEGALVPGPFGSWLSTVLDGLQIKFHWICTIEDDAVREKFQKAVGDGQAFIFAPAMFIYFKDEVDGTTYWHRGEIWFNREDPARNAIMPLSRARIGRTTEDIIENVKGGEDATEEHREEVLGQE